MPKRQSIRALGGSAAVIALVLLTATTSAPAAAIGASAAAANPPVVLYDAALGTRPDQQQMQYQAINGKTFGAAQATQTLVPGATILDTTPQQNDLAGYAASTPQVPVLDRSYGYSVTFAVQIQQETHVSNNRAGFSLTLIGNDKKGIEVAFWKDHIWVQNDGTAEPPGGTLFTHGEDVAFNTSTQIFTYTVSVKNNTYSISNGGNTLLSGSMRDYTAWQPPLPGIPNPYQTPNLIVLSDNTTSASGTFRLAYVAVASAKRSVYLPLIRK